MPLHQSRADSSTKSRISKPVEICDIFALGYRSGRGVVDDLAGARSEHDLHMDESDGQFARIERASDK